MNYSLAPGSNPNGETFMGAGEEKDVEVSSVEQIKGYLEKELGGETLSKVLPIIKSFGDDILFVDKI
jgi:hypothetical protein